MHLNLMNDFFLLKIKIFVKLFAFEKVRFW